MCVARTVLSVRAGEVNPVGRSPARARFTPRGLGKHDRRAACCAPRGETSHLTRAALASFEVVLAATLFQALDKIRCHGWVELHRE